MPFQVEVQITFVGSARQSATGETKRLLVGAWSSPFTRLLRAGKLLLALAFGVALAACKGGGAIPGAGPPPVHGPPVRDDWPMFAHDARHTSASAANIPGALRVVWRYDPQAATGDTFSSVYNAIATVNGVYVHWFQSAPTILGAGPSLDAVSTTGARTWTWIAKRDFDEGHWSSIFNNGVVFQDDGQELLDLGTGKVQKSLFSSFDTWGESIPDPSGFYAANTFLADGPDLVVYSIDSTYAIRWKALQQTSTKYSQDSNGAILLSNGTVFYAALYSDPNPHPIGLYALNSSTGAQVAYVATTPLSDMSADGSNIYLIESPDSLVARSQSSLAKVWSVAVSSPISSAPVIANGLVIVGTFSGIEAHDPATGKLMWSAAVQPNAFGANSTAMCAALGSNTLVVAAFDGMHVLNLANGSDLWHGSIAGVQGTAANPVIVNDPALGATVYVTDSRGVIALAPTTSARLIRP